MKTLSLEEFKQLELSGSLVGKYMWYIEDSQVIMSSKKDTLYIQRDNHIVEICKSDLTGYKTEDGTLKLNCHSDSVTLDYSTSTSLYNALVDFCSEVSEITKIPNQSVKTKKSKHRRKNRKRKSSK